MNLSIYPNPTTNALVLEGETVSEFTVLSTDGRTVHSGQGNKVDVMHLIPGTYFLKAVTPDGIAVKQFRKL
jgi:hypothetical protein